MFNIKKYPTPIGGLALGILGVGSAWGIIFNSSQAIAMVTTLVLGLLILLPLLYKFLKHPKLLLEEIKHPVVGSATPAFAMAFMIIGFILSRWNLHVGLIVWGLAVIVHLIFFTIFATSQLKNLSFDNIIPSWFVPPIGIVTACVSLPDHSLNYLASYIFYFGIGSYAILLPTVLIRLIIKEKLDHKRAPTMGILAAPASLCLAGYLTITQQPNALLILALFTISTLLLIVIYIMLFSLLRLPFSPAFSCFTFPLAISTTAMFKISVWSKGVPLLAKYADSFYLISKIELIIATLVIGFVLGHFIIHLIQQREPSKKLQASLT